MPTVEDFQFISLILSILSVLSMIIIGIFRENARLFYLSLVMGWIPGIIYYIIILYFNDAFINLYGYSASHLSASLRTYQYFVFGCWFTFDAMSILFSRLKNKSDISKVEQKIEFLSEKIKKGDKNG